MMKKIKGFFSEEKGQGMTEYGLILGLIALAVVVILTTFGETLTTKFTEIKDELLNAGSTTTTTPSGS